MSVLSLNLHFLESFKDRTNFSPIIFRFMNKMKSIWTKNGTLQRCSLETKDKTRPGREHREEH